MTDFYPGMKLDIRAAAGKYLSELGKKYPDVMVLSADLTGNAGAASFAAAYPDRYYNMGIAEQNMVSFAAGLTYEGFKPYLLTMSPFISMRACEQVRSDVCYCSLPVRFFGNNSGYSGGISGATHCGLEDCAIIGAMGNMTILEPCDAYEAAMAVEASYAVKGPVYIRITSFATPAVYTEEFTYEIGKAQIPVEGDDAAFIVSGAIVSFAVEAAKRLKEELGVHVRVVDMHTIKPLDEKAVLAAAKTGTVIAAQDHTKIGGLGWAVANTIAQAGVSCKFKILGAPDTYVPLATTPFLYKQNGYDADGLYENMKALL